MKSIILAIVGLIAAYVIVLQIGYFHGVFGVKRHHLESAAFILVAALVLRVWLSRAGPDGQKGSGAPRLGVVVALVAGGAYFSAVGVGLLSDDYVLRSWVLNGRLSWEGSQFARPVALAAWRVVFLLGGGAAALHVLNIALHLINTVLAAKVAGALGLRRRGIMITAAVFVLWPTQVEPVVWAAGIFDVLATTWMLLAVLVCLRDEPLMSSALDCLLVGGLAALALWTKESAVALPGLALVAMAPEWARTRRVPRRQVGFVTVMTCSTAGYFLWRMVSGLPLAGVSALSRYAAKEQLSRTFGSLAVPLSTQTMNAFPAVALLFALATVTLGVVSALAPPRRTTGQVVAIQGLVWCLVATAPALGFLFIGSYLEGSRYLYLAALGWGLTLAGMVESSARNLASRTAVDVLLAGVIFAAALQQQQSLAEWRAAAAQRDRMLPEAARLADGMQCASVSVTNLPATLKGAQLFNNGFPEALRAVRSKVPGIRDCRLTWSGAAFREH